MATYVFEESAAATAVGTDIASGVRGQTSPKARVIRGLAVVGSTAAGDAAIDLYGGDLLLGRFYNSSTGTAYDMSKDFVPIGNVILLPNEPLHIVVADSGVGNKLYIHVTLDELR